LELLLLISALLTGITGVMSGGRQAEVPQVELSASVQAAEAAVQIAEASIMQAPAFAIILSLAVVLFLRPLARWRIKAPAMAHRDAPRCERRLE
jgi:hypothetical protein